MESLVGRDGDVAKKAMALQPRWMRDILVANGDERVNIALVWLQTPCQCVGVGIRSDVDEA